MTARSLRSGEDADEFDVEEALALVKEDNGAAHRAPAPPPQASGRASEPHAHHKATPWAEARATAARAARAVTRGARRAPVSVRLEDALGLTLAAPLDALTDLPSFNTSAMDGWAVAGPGPWAVRDEGVLAGHAEPAPLTDGEAARIATGARIPRTPPPSCAASTDRPTRRAGCTPPGRSSTARTSARADRSAAAATSFCRPAPSSPRPSSVLPRPPDTTPSPLSPAPASKSSSSATSCSPRVLRATA